ncbi:MAG: PEP-CTERM sorting domain-containing protein [Pirellulales bacterium]|nr:PEP-CTERM sorting domain-containing protein [Pirellulales bacterium]
MKRFVTAFAVCMIACVAQVASAAVFFTDAFEYEDGQLTAHNEGANVSGGLWTTHSPTPVQTVTASTMQVLDGAAVVKTSGVEDVNRVTGFTQSEGETWYYAARFSVNDLRDPPGTGALASANQYFIHFKDDGTFNFRSRLYVLPPNDAESPNFTLGLSSSSVSGGNGQVVNWSSDLTFGETYTVVVSYKAFDSDPETTDDGFASLWVNPSSSASPSITDTLPNSNITTGLMTSLALRQNGAGSSNPDVLVDVVSIGNSFDDVLAALGGGGGEFAAADFNENGAVDGTDLGIWAGGYGSTGAPKSSGDATGEGDVDGADFLVWQREYTGPPAVGAVPEPTSVGLVLVGLAVLARRKK